MDHGVCRGSVNQTDWKIGAYFNICLKGWTLLDFYLFIIFNNTVFQQGCIKLIKSDSKDIYECMTVSTKVLNSTTVFNIDNNNNKK